MTGKNQSICSSAAIELVKGLESDKLLEILQGYLDPKRKDSELVKAILEILSHRL